MEAIEYAKSVESKFEDDHNFWFIVGGIYFILDDAKKAIPLFEKALKLKNDDVEPDVDIELFDAKTDMDGC